MDKVTYTLGIDFIVNELEKICSQFLHIEDIELCFFSPFDRYPLDRAKLHHYNKEVITNYPQLPLYSLPLVKDTIAYALYRNNSLAKHFFNNLMLSEEDIRNLKDEEEIKGLDDNTLYYSLPKRHYCLSSIISTNIPIIQFNEIERTKTTIYKKIQKKFREQYGEQWIMSKEVLEKYMVEIFESKIELNDMFDKSDLGEMKTKLEVLLSLIINSVEEMNLPSYRLFTVDDSSREIKVVFGEAILERRLKEANIF